MYDVSSDRIDFKPATTLVLDNVSLSIVLEIGDRKVNNHCHRIARCKNAYYCNIVIICIIKSHFIVISRT